MSSITVFVSCTDGVGFADYLELPPGKQTVQDVIRRVASRTDRRTYAVSLESRSNWIPPADHQLTEGEKITITSLIF